MANDIMDKVIISPDRAVIIKGVTRAKKILQRR